MRIFYSLWFVYCGPQRYIKDTKDWQLVRMSTGLQSCIANTGGGRTRQIRYTYHSVPFPIFQSIFLQDNGKEYIEYIDVNGNKYPIRNKVNVIKHGSARYTTKVTNGYCPELWLADKLNFGRIIQQCTKNGDVCRLKYPNVTYMIQSGNIIFESDLKWLPAGSLNSTHFVSYH